MVARAPTFAQIADELAERIGGCVFVAHNARFDYGFLKHEFGRLRRAFSAQVLCTVKLSRRLYPDAARHNLDTIIERHGLATEHRHRALGDARILWEFAQCVYREKSADEVSSAVARILRRPSLPPQLPADALSAIPESPGVYFFYGLNALPLYIGKSVNLRERIGAHFSSDYRSANDVRLSAEITRIEVEPTAGELGALLREAELIKALLPAYNQRLRRRSDMVALSLGDASAPPDYIRSAAIDPGALEGLFGPFTSRASARATLRELAAQAGLCWTALGLERRVGPCFARQVRRCRGACVGEESAQSHAARLREALSPLAFKRWPYRGAVSVCERDLLGERSDVHVFRDWCWLGTARDDGGARRADRSTAARDVRPRHLPAARQVATASEGHGDPLSDITRRGRCGGKCAKLPAPRPAGTLDRQASCRVPNQPCRGSFVSARRDGSPSCLSSRSLTFVVLEPWIRLAHAAAGELERGRHHVSGAGLDDGVARRSADDAGARAVA